LEVREVGVLMMIERRVWCRRVEVCGVKSGFRVRTRSGRRRGAVRTESAGRRRRGADAGAGEVVFGQCADERVDRVDVGVEGGEGLAEGRGRR